MGHDEADAFVFFGATGDLAYRQIFPALQALITRGQLEMPIIGVARSATGIDALRSRARESLETHGGVDPRAFATLSARLQYINGDYREAETFRQLRRALERASRPLFYLAIPPDMFPMVVQGLSGGVPPGSPCRRREAIRPRPGLGPGSQPSPSALLPRVGHFPDRPLPGEGTSPEPSVFPFRQFVSRADLEPPIHQERRGDDG
jgi:hypothetical protein